MTRTTRLLAGLALGLMASRASAQVVFSEILVNAPGTDQGNEYIELGGPNGASLNNLTILILEGDGASAGSIDQALSLSGQSIGTSGLFLWRDAATVLSPAPNPGTTIKVQDFNPDIENGGQTYLLVSNFSGALNQDLDTNNDGVIDLFPWASVVAAIGYSQSTGDGAPSLNFADDFGGSFVPQQGFTPDALALLGSTYYYMDVLGTTPGPFTSDPIQITPALNPGASITLTPGSANVPEPTTLVLLAAGTALGRIRRSARASAAV
ncbi:MAG: PEP-CTERM sorting domain-containing protein [Phycisphaerae bacterium]